MSGKPRAIRFRSVTGSSMRRGDWEVTGRPYTTRAGKVVHVTIQRPGEPASAKEKASGSHERLMILRETATPTPKATPKTRRESGRRAKAH